MASNQWVIFVVDDEPVIAETLGSILRRQGFAVECFTQPQSALHRSSVLVPDLLISDVVMPDLSGVVLAIEIRRRAPRCEVLLFSGQAATADHLAEARRAGYEFELLPKPIHPKDLLAKVGMVLRTPEKAGPEAVRPDSSTKQRA